ncbi:hypothetical protein FISHEDRAFT_37751 [Fistulina hepatica ATCC 64428]|nr:hypothetical protein FISHEDRAFT_37751 [Fistulina hepatica ATCC 64428]
MNDARWDPVIVRGHLRAASQQLGQINSKLDIQGQITRRDIATLLRQGDVALARAKGQKLILEDATADCLEVLEACVARLTTHLNEIRCVSPPPVIVEAASSTIAIEYETELRVIRGLLVQRLGPTFARSATSNSDGHVSLRVVQILSAPPPSAATLDRYLMEVSRANNVHWIPEPRRQDIVNPLSEMLDPQAAPIVDIARLRKLCALGIPDNPVWLRPRIWKLFYGTLPEVKSSWASEMHKQRSSYYDLVRRLLEPFADLPPPTTPLNSLDNSLFQVSKSLSRIPDALLVRLEDDTEMSSPTLCPLDDDAPDGIRIPCAKNLDVRMKFMQDARQRSGSGATPEIRLEVDDQPSETPMISLSAPDVEPESQYDTAPSTTEAPSPRRESTPTTLLASKTYGVLNIPPKHESALRRLLYLHASINPGNLSPHIPSLLVPLYSVLNLEIDPEEMPHVEADTFWLFEAMVGEFSELEDEEGGSVWMKKFSERLLWADPELWESLSVKGLDPALPHYSYRWLAPLLTQTLPLSSVALVWDAIFAQEMRKRDSNPKLEYLLDMCTGMLISARTPLYRLGKTANKSPSLWGREHDTLPPPSPIRAWELGDAFVEGINLLQSYPVDAIGGIDRLLQTAADLAHRRLQAAQKAQTGNTSLSSRLKETMWRGFTNQVSSPQDSSEDSEDSDDSTDMGLAYDDDLEEEDGHDTERPSTAAGSGITSRLTSTPPSDLPAPQSPNSSHLSAPTTKTAKLWSYAEKLKDSDTAARLSKASSNWRAKALSSWGGMGSRREQSPASSTPLRSGSHGYSASEGGDYVSPSPAINSSSFSDRGGSYSPPARPTFFKPPPSPKRESGFLTSTRHLQASLASLAPTKQPAKKMGPRPLLLGSTAPITTSSMERRASRTPTPTPPSQDGPGHEADWRAIRARGHKQSESSVSSASPYRSSRSDWESDATNGGSRIVRLNRGSVSPMAPPYRVERGHTHSESESTSEMGMRSPSTSAASAHSLPSARRPRSKGWGQVETSDSPPMPSPPPETPITDSEASIMESPLVKKSLRRHSPSVSIRSSTASDTSNSSASVVPVSRRSRVRSRRGNRPPNLRLEHSPRLPEVRPVSTSPGTLGVERPDEDADLAPTPKASSFEGLTDASSASPSSPDRIRRPRKLSSEGRRKNSGDGDSSRSRKISNGSMNSRTRKISTESKSSARKVRESAAIEGDDEGYDEFLSVYESEDSAAP